MTDTKTIQVGNASDSTYVAFGDDCQFNDICGYVLIGLRRSRIGVITRELDRIKDGFKIPRSTPLHCRVLCGFHQREKAGLGHLTREDAQNTVLRCLLLLNNYGMHVKFAHARLSEFSAKLGDTLTLSDQQQANPIDLAVHHDPKGLISLLSQTSMIVPWADRKLSRFNAVEIVASADKTQAKLFGNGSRQAHNLLQGFSDIGAAPGSVFQFSPRISTTAEDPLLQLADVVVYALCHQLDEEKGQSFWRTQLPPIKNLQSIPWGSPPIANG